MRLLDRARAQRLAWTDLRLAAAVRPATASLTGRFALAVASSQPALGSSRGAILVDELRCHVCFSLVLCECLAASRKLLGTMPGVRKFTRPSWAQRPRAVLATSEPWLRWLRGQGPRRSES